MRDAWKNSNHRGAIYGFLWNQNSNFTKLKYINSWFKGLNEPNMGTTLTGEIKEWNSYNPCTGNPIKNNSIWHFSHFLANSVKQQHLGSLHVRSPDRVSASPHSTALPTVWSLSLRSGLIPNEYATLLSSPDQRERYLKNWLFFLSNALQRRSPK